MLVVAEKCQTGFDQPLLHTMHVDKVLTGLTFPPQPDPSGFGSVGTASVRS